MTGRKGVLLPAEQRYIPIEPHLSDKRKRKLKQKGTATVEAAIILPLLILALLAVLSIIRITVTYERMQHALNQVAEDMSQYSYLYAISGLKEKHDAFSDEIRDAKEELLEQQEALNTFYESVHSVFGNVTDFGKSDKTAINNLWNSLDGVNNVSNSWKDLTQQVEDILKDPMGEVRLITLAFSDTLFGQAKTALLGSLAKCMLEERLSNELNIPVKELKERLRITDGIQELDLSCSTFFDDKETIDLIVEYTLKPMPDFFFLPEIRLRNRACILSWTWGVDRKVVETDQSKTDSESIWNLDKTQNSMKQHFGRGNTAESRFTDELINSLGKHAEGTPYHFKTIDVINYAHDGKDGSLITIFSLNPFLPTYSKESAVAGQIRKKLYQLSEFRRYKTKDYMIDTALLDGTYKRIVYIVVPENGELPEAYLDAFEKSVDTARSLGIELIQVKKYGVYEKAEENEQAKPEEDEIG